MSGVPSRSSVIAWMGRAVVAFGLIAPFVGALQPISSSGLSLSALVHAPELKLIVRTASWSCVMTLATVLACLVIAPVFLARRSHEMLRHLCALLTTTFFIPPILKGYTFYWLWDKLGFADASPYGMIVLWSVIYYSVFFWGCLYAFATTAENRSALDALAELQTLLQTGPVLARLLAPSILLASVCILMFCMFGGMEYPLFTRDQVHSVGQVMLGLFGGRDLLAAQLSLALLIALGVILFLFFWLAGRTGSAVSLIER